MNKGSLFKVGDIYRAYTAEDLRFHTSFVVVKGITRAGNPRIIRLKSCIVRNASGPGGAMEIVRPGNERNAEKFICRYNKKHVAYTFIDKGMRYGIGHKYDPEQEYRNDYYN